MSRESFKPALLLLEDGSLFHGRSVGKVGTATGELCFNTGMTGYQEIFTDPSYYGQLMVMTNVHIGNYGTHKDENESDSVKISGLIVKNFNQGYSRQLGDSSLQDYLEDNAVVGISDIDTRALVRHIRSKGAMNAVISSEIDDVNELNKILASTPNMKGLELASKVSTEKPYSKGDYTSNYRVAVMDFGVKRSILKNLEKRGCNLRVFPHNASFEEINQWGPDGYFLSNGPGDPAAMDDAVELTKLILDSGKPVFGICLGHQLIARAIGMKTYKMFYGHRGINHPVINVKTGLSEITSQNHGFGVDKESAERMSDVVDVTHVNLNDDSIEGFALKNKKIFSVQYHPEASPGPHDSRYLFDQFLKLLSEN